MNEQRLAEIKYLCGVCAVTTDLEKALEIFERFYASDIPDLLAEVERLEALIGTQKAVIIKMQSQIDADVERLREKNDRYEEALLKFKQIQYSGERYDNTPGIRSNRAACVFCGRFHNEHSHRDDCPFKVVNEVNG